MDLGRKQMLNEPKNDVFCSRQRVELAQEGWAVALVGRQGLWRQARTLEVGAWSLVVARELWRWVGRQGRSAPSTRLSAGDEEGGREGERDRGIECRSRLRGNREGGRKERGTINCDQGLRRGNETWVGFGKKIFLSVSTLPTVMGRPKI